MGRADDWILPAVMIAAATAFAALILSILTGYPARPNGVTSLTVAIVVVTMTGLVRFLIYVFRLWRAEVEHPIDRIVQGVKPAALDFAPIIAGVSIVAVFLYSITFLKSMITAVVPFWADGPLANLDRAIFVDPAAIASALSATLPAFGLFYGSWHVANLGGILWVLHWRRGTKGRFILSFMLTWAIGITFAYLFSSAGPIFTGEFAWSIAPASVRTPAAMLWANYQAKGALLGGGISAFPSLHVAIATWFALVLRERGLPKVGAAYAVAIFFCSIVLGWHYVADGIAGAAIALVADRLSQFWLERGRIRRIGSFDSALNRRNPA